MRQYVKPSIELMGALQRLFGFLAGLWLAPLIEEYLADYCIAYDCTNSVMLLHSPGNIYQKPFSRKYLKATKRLYNTGYLLSSWFAFTVSVPLEAFLFHGTLRDWFKLN